MTKSRLVFLFLFIISLILIAYYFWPKNQRLSEKEKIDDSDFIASERVYIDQKGQPIPTPKTAPKFVNAPSPDWELKLYQQLKAQGGELLQDIKIEKENSLVWMRDNNPLLVESVKISLKNKAGEESSFRALVDAQTGKVLETWDRSISDPANVREDFRFKLDPRYRR